VPTKEPEKLELEWVPLEELSEDPSNVNVHDERSVEAIAASIKRFGWRKPIVAGKDGVLVAGSGALRAARKLGLPHALVLRCDLKGAERAAYAIADNRTGRLSYWDPAALAKLLKEIDREDPELRSAAGWTSEELSGLLSQINLGGGEDGFGGDGAGGEGGSAEPGPNLAERFLVPPLSVLDMRQGYWRQRRAWWMEKGLRSEVGRGRNLLGMSETVLNSGDGMGAKVANAEATIPDYYKRLKRLGTQEAVIEDYLERGGGGGGTSIFDPVLCELMYRWYCPPGARILDPFSGGSVRGVVAALLGHTYHGFELREEQIEANREQRTEILGTPSNPPRWFKGDASDLLRDRSDEALYDFMFTCPPYWNLERYSEDPRDLSNMMWPEFVDALSEILAGALDCLNNNRFAAVVIGDVRNERGDVVPFERAVTSAMNSAGAELYNDAILVGPAASAALRASRIFKGGRKLARVHQRVLIYCKGAWKIAQEEIGEVPDRFYGEAPAEDGLGEVLGGLAVDIEDDEDEDDDE